MKKPMLLHSFLAASVISGPIAVVALTAGKMQGKELIEYQDRAWRLQNHIGQNRVDDYCGIGMIAGIGVFF